MGLLAYDIGRVDLFTEQLTLFLQVFLVTLAIMIELAETAILLAEAKVNVFQFTYLFTDSKIDVAQFFALFIMLVTCLSDVFTQLVNTLA